MSLAKFVTQIIQDPHFLPFVPMSDVTNSDPVPQVEQNNSTQLCDFHTKLYYYLYIWLIFQRLRMFDRYSVEYILTNSSNF